MEIRHGVMYLADLNPRVGSEAGKIRPVVVIQTDLLNQAGHPSTWILPCTTNLTGDSLLRVELPKGIAGNDEHCEVMIDQNRAIDNGRFRKKLKPLPRSILNELKEKIRLLGDF
jgi:mRNA interferase MazF